MRTQPTQIPIPTDPNKQLAYLVTYWDTHGNLNEVVLPEGSDRQALMMAMLSEGILSRPDGGRLCDTIYCLPIGEQKPTDWDAVLAEYPPNMVMRSLVEHGTPGAISLDICPYGTLIATAKEMRERVQAGLELMSLQPQRI